MNTDGYVVCFHVDESLSYVLDLCLRACKTCVVMRVYTFEQ